MSQNPTIPIDAKQAETFRNFLTQSRCPVSAFDCWLDGWSIRSFVTTSAFAAAELYMQDHADEQRDWPELVFVNVQERDVETRCARGPLRRVHLQLARSYDAVSELG